MKCSRHAAPYKLLFIFGGLFLVSLSIHLYDTKISFDPIISTMSENLNPAFDCDDTKSMYLDQLEPLVSFKHDKRTTRLSRLIQNRLDFLQNPQNCSSAHKLVCSMKDRPWKCGFGCRIHHLTYCFMVSYGLKRTFVLDSEGWDYSSNGWSSFFQTVSRTCCAVPNKRDIVLWEGQRNLQDLQKYQVISLPPDASESQPLPLPSFYPTLVPKDLEEELSRLPGHPEVWLIAQFLRYLLRPQPFLVDLIKQRVRKMGLSKPYAGIHVRRTDKIIETKKYMDLENYMQFAQTFFDSLNMHNTSTERKVFLATDEQKVIKEMQQKYHDYQAYYDLNCADLARQSSRRVTQRNVNDLICIILDIHLLSHADHLTCTFSSNVCLLSYELMYTFSANPSKSVVSLDLDYFFWMRFNTYQYSIASNTVTNSPFLDMEVGDVLLWPGWRSRSRVFGRNPSNLNNNCKTKKNDTTASVCFLGKNLRTGNTGWVSTLNVRRYFGVADTPSYAEADARLPC